MSQGGTDPPGPPWPGGPSGYGTDCAVLALAVWDDGGGSALYAAGDFTTAGGEPERRWIRRAKSPPLPAANPTPPTEGTPTKAEAGVKGATRKMPDLLPAALLWLPLSRGAGVAGGRQ